jgi:hypothetical protein
MILKMRGLRATALRAQKNTNINDYFPQAGFDVLRAVPGRRAAFHD